MGAWIETYHVIGYCGAHYVAPYVGAWIETLVKYKHSFFLKSHPTWVRGLKPFGMLYQVGKDKSHPTWVRGLKHVNCIYKDK